MRQDAKLLFRRPIADHPPMSPSEPGALGPIDLSKAAPFTLGPLRINPPTREVRTDDRVVVAEPRALQVLTALHQAGGSVVGRDELLRRCWDGRIVGEDAINRSIAKARQLADLVQPAAFVIETIPRVGHRLRLAEPAAPAASPGPKGERLLRRPSRRTLGVFGAGAALSAAAAGGALLWFRPIAVHAQPPLIAVLPFDNLSADPQLRYFADGLAEDILDTLTQAGGLRVSARSSSFTFRSADKDKAATTLGADFVLDGSVLREGNRLRVNAHLNDAHTRQTLWSQSYDRELGQGLQIEDDIAQQVAGALKVQLAPHTPRLIDPQVYDLYLKGREATRQHDPTSVAQGEVQLRQVVAKAPDFADAWFQLARNRWRAGFFLPESEQEGSYALGRDAARRALALDPHRGAAYGVIAQLTPPYHHWDEIEEGLKRGLALSPTDSDMMMWRGEFLLSTGRSRAAVDMVRRAWTIDPLEYANNQFLYEALSATRRFSDAEGMVKRIQAIWPTQLGAYWDWFWILLTSGRELQAAAFLEDKAHRIGDSSPKEFPVLIDAARAAVSTSQSQRKAVAQRCIDLAGDGLGYALNSMLLLGRLGEDEAAADLARAIYLKQGPIHIDRSVMYKGGRSYQPFDQAPPDNLFNPLVARARRDRRFEPIFDAIGLTDFWRKAGPPDPP